MIEQPLGGWSAAKGSAVYRYDPVGNLTNIDHAVSLGITLRRHAVNRVTNMVDAVGTTAYVYTAGAQLWTEYGPFASDTVTNAYFDRLRAKLSLAQPTGVWTDRFTLTSRFLLLAAALPLALAGCERRAKPETVRRPSLTPTNAAVQATGTNWPHVITVEEATQIAEQEARHRGRDKVRVMSRRFHRNEWVIGLEFEPYDQVGNQSWVYVTTNGTIKWYIHGR